jgi:hypothetical protein
MHLAVLDRAASLPGALFQVQGASNPVLHGEMKEIVSIIFSWCWGLARAVRPRGNTKIGARALRLADSRDSSSGDDGVRHDASYDSTGPYWPAWPAVTGANARGALVKTRPLRPELSGMADVAGVIEALSPSLVRGAVASLLSILVGCSCASP